MTPLSLLNAGLALLLGFAAARGDDPASRAELAEEGGAGRPPVFVVLDPKQGEGLGALLDRLREPDFVLLDGTRYRDLLAALKQGASPEATEPEPTPDSVAIRGDLGGEVADLDLSYVFVLKADGPVRAPLRLDEGQVLTSVREGERDLGPVSEGGAWFVELAGRGRHEVVVSLRLPIRSVPEGERLELAIPEAPTTLLELRSPVPLAEVKLAGGLPVAVESVEGSPGSRIVASLTPRPLLELTWRTGSSGQEAMAALLTAHGDLAVDVEPGSVRITGTYEIRAERGVARSLGVRLDPSDELIAVEIDGQAVETREAASDGYVELPMAQPLRPGTSRKLTIVARRHLPMGGATRTVLQGFPLRDVAVQAGLIAVAQSGSLSVGGGAGSDLRRVDPRVELPPSLRVRPSNVLAYQFFDQPFELELQIDPSPPWVRVDSKTTVSLASRLARVDARLDFQVARGRVFEVRVALPAGLRLDSVGPDRWVSSVENLPESTAGGGVVLAVTLSDAARDAGRFELHLTGRQDVDPDGRVDVSLFRPLNVTARRGSLAVLTTRDVTADLVESPHFTAADTEVPASWVWPDGRESSEQAPNLWLLDDGESDSLALRAEVHRRALRHQTTLDALIERTRVEVRQETLVRVDYGTIARLDVAVPEALEGRWEPEGVEVTRREPLGAGVDGAARYRLVLAREVSDQVRLRFRIRWDLGGELDDQEPRPIEIEAIRLLEGESEPPLVRVSADDGIGLEPQGEGWSTRGVRDAAEASTAQDSAARLVRTGARAAESPAVVLATAPALAALPGVVASRLWLRTVLEADGTIKASASYRLEVHRSELTFTLPTGVEPTLVHVGETVVSEVERLPEPSCFRIRFPASAPTGPVTVRIEYDLPNEARGTPAWAAPRLHRGGVVQWTFWEARVPWREVLVGVPEGWSDENRWAWDFAIWSRRPRYSTAELASWAGDPKSALVLSPAAVSPRGDSHVYLFSRPGAPGVLRPWAATRAALVAGCSGVALAFGLVLLIARPSRRVVGLATAGATIAVAATVHPSVMVLLVQSAALGIVLALLAVAMQWVVEHRLRGQTRAFPESRDLGASSGTHVAADTVAPSSQRRPPTAQDSAEGSTIIRPRPGSTVPRLAPARPGPEDEVEVEGEAGGET